MTQDRVSQCIGKAAHTAAMAKKIARAMNKRGKRDVAITAYQCRICKHWHVGGNK